MTTFVHVPITMQPTVEGDEDGYPTAFEQALDRVAVSVGEAYQTIFMNE